MNRITHDNTSQLLKAVNKYGQKSIEQYESLPLDIKLASNNELTDSAFNLLGNAWWENFTIAMTYPQKDLDRSSEHLTPRNYLSFAGFQSMNGSPLDTFSSATLQIEKNIKELEDNELYGGPCAMGNGHWIGIYLDKTNKTIYAFNSTHAHTPSEVQVRDLNLQQTIDAIPFNNRDRYELARGQSGLEAFHAKMKAALGNEYDDYKVIHNSTKFQYNGYDCGPWTALFTQFIRNPENRLKCQSAATLDQEFKSYIHKITNQEFNAQNSNVIGQLIRHYFKIHHIDPRLNILNNKYKLIGDAKRNSIKPNANIKPTHEQPYYSKPSGSTKFPEIMGLVLCTLTGAAAIALSITYLTPVLSGITIGAAASIIILGIWDYVTSQHKSHKPNHKRDTIRPRHSHSIGKGKCMKKRPYTAKKPESRQQEPSPALHFNC